MTSVRFPSKFRLMSPRVKPGTRWTVIVPLNDWLAYPALRLKSSESNGKPERFIGNPCADSELGRIMEAFALLFIMPLEYWALIEAVVALNGNCATCSGENAIVVFAEKMFLSSFLPT